MEVAAAWLCAQGGWQVARCRLKWRWCQNSFIWLRRRFPRQRDVVSADGDTITPLERISRGEYSRQQCRRDLRSYVRPGTVVRVTNARIIGSSSCASLSASSPSTRSNSQQRDERCSASVTVDRSGCSASVTVDRSGCSAFVSVSAATSRLVRFRRGAPPRFMGASPWHRWPVATGGLLRKATASYCC
jgi:hypothetical protein